MILSHIESAIAGYKEWLQQTRQHPHVYKWESLQHFQTHWDLEAADPAAMYENSFYNSETRRLWQTETWQPKRMMAEFWRFDPMTVRLMFEDLYNETREAEGRIARFLFGCDALLSDYKKARPLSVDNNHYHGDFRMISLYLAFRYPEKYALYTFPDFQKAMMRLGSLDVPQANDPARYFRVLRTLMTFLEKDAGVQAAMNRHLHPRKHFQGKTLLLAEDFCYFVAQ